MISRRQLLMLACAAASVPLRAVAIEARPRVAPAAATTVTLAISGMT